MKRYNESRLSGELCLTGTDGRGSGVFDGEVVANNGRRDGRHGPGFDGESNAPSDSWRSARRDFG
uniref:Transposase n=1 Tax=Haemonchus placei TaxID=6290 RepID=A0A0N4XBV7_HAEPC